MHSKGYFTTKNSFVVEVTLEQNPPIFFGDYENFNEEDFKTELCELDWSFVTDKNDINLLLWDLHFINKILDKHVPIKKVKKWKNKIISKPWITRCIKTWTKKRDKLFKQMIKAKNKQQKLIKYKSHKK